MSLLDKVSLLVTPNSVKANKLYAVVPANGTGDLAVVRNTTATKVNINGVDELVALNVARLNYDSVGGVPSLLIEPQRTNLLLNSATLSTQSISTTATAHTLSFRGTGTVTLSGSFTGSLVGTGVNNRVTLTFTPTAATLTVTISGSCTNGQVEAASSATSYIPSGGSATTRVADVITKSGISNLIGQQEGSVFIDCVVNSASNASANIFNFEKNTASTVSISRDANTKKIKLTIISNGVFLNFLTISSTYNLGDRLKIGLRYKSGDIKLFVNSIQEVTSTSTYSFTQSINEIFLADRINFFAFQETTTINSFQLYKSPLTDAELTSLTTL